MCICDIHVPCTCTCILLYHNYSLFSPSVCYTFAENKPLKVLIEFSLEKPQGGVQFVLPPDGATAEAMVS